MYNPVEDVMSPNTLERDPLEIVVAVKLGRNKAQWGALDPKQKRQAVVAAAARLRGLRPEQFKKWLQDQNLEAIWQRNGGK